MLNGKEILEEIIKEVDAEITHWVGLAKKKKLFKGKCFRDQCLAKAAEARYFKLMANSLKERAKGD